MLWNSFFFQKTFHCVALPALKLTAIEIFLPLSPQC